jgi:hypothetical protein
MHISFLLSKEHRHKKKKMNSFERVGRGQKSHQGASRSKEPEDEAGWEKETCLENPVVGKCVG